MTLKFKKDGQTKAVLKDEASEPVGIIYLEDNVLPDDIEVSTDSGVKSLEELDAELEGEDLE